MCSIRYKLRKIFLINKVTKKTNDIKKKEPKIQL